VIRRKIQLAHVDLNLLVALQALLDTSSVTRAARRVGVTQSAMSHSLRRLRALLGDDVLVRGRSGMTPTPIAEAMRDELTAGLRAVQATLRSTEGFDPAQATHHFRISAPDYVHLRFAPRLVAEVGRQAPGLSLHFRAFEGLQAAQALVAGDLDVAVTGELPDMPEPIVRQLLGREQVVCAVRADHPDVGDRLDVAQYAALPHIEVSPHDRTGLVDDLLATHGLQRRVALRLQNFLSSPFVLLRTNYVLTAPEGVIDLYRRSLPLRVIQPPLELPPVLIFMYWHERNHDDPAMRWLRATIAHAFGP